MIMKNKIKDKENVRSNDAVELSDDELSAVAGGALPISDSITKGELRGESSREQITAIKNSIANRKLKK